ncbi:MAG: hypothetical protein L0H41_14010 [Microlunatus sp.]|nr:hypothetical protein [Microlunatus sp.]
MQASYLGSSVAMYAPASRPGLVPPCRDALINRGVPVDTWPDRLGGGVIVAIWPDEHIRP